MIANWMERSLLLSPEREQDERALKAIAAACDQMDWNALAAGSRNDKTDGGLIGSPTGLPVSQFSEPVR